MSISSDLQTEIAKEKHENTVQNVTVTNRLHLMAQEYRKTASIRAISLDFPFVVDSKEGQLEGKSGDYLAIGADDSPEQPHRWVISKSDFEKTYELVINES